MEDASLKVNLNENQNSDALIIDQNAQQLQQTLLEMGYDLSMINKVITHFHVKTKDEAIYYLSKNDDLWNHPFIPLEEEPAQSSNAFANAPQNLMSKAFTQFGGEVTQKCEICGEYAETHRFVHHEEKKEDNVVIEEHKEENLLIEEKKEEDSQLCGICLGELENPLQMQGCSHRFCRGCFYDYLVNKISINDIEAIPCPNKECGNKKLSEEFFIQYLSEEQAYKYATFKSKNEIAKEDKAFKESLAASGANSWANRNSGKMYTVLGFLQNLRQIHTKTGKDMAFAKLQDYDGEIDLTFFSKTWESLSSKLQSGNVYAFKGRVDGTREQPSFIVDSLEDSSSSKRTLREV